MNQRQANKLSLYASGGISPKTEREEKGRLNGSFSDDDAIPGGGMGWIGRRKEKTNNIKYSFYELRISFHTYLLGNANVLRGIMLLDPNNF